MKFLLNYGMVIAGLLFTAFSAYAQLNTARIAQNRLQSGKWESAYRVLKKSVRKDSTDIESQVVLTQWFLATGNPDYHVDSADYYLRTSAQIYDSLSIRERERIQRFPIDSAVLAALRQYIDSVAFEQAKQVNNELVYTRYLNRFPGSRQTQQALELRDEVSYLNALRENTVDAFQTYLQKYPASVRASEAKSRYEKLLFEEKTSDKKLASYQQFVAHYPTSPYARHVHQQIFEITTASGEPESFIQYLMAYPNGPFAQSARNILFHLYREWDEKIPDIVLTDSLKSVLAVDKQSWITIFKNGLFGFMDQTGKEVLAPRFDHIEEDYKCEAVRDDVLVLKAGVFSRTGKKLAEAGEHVTPMGYGFLKVTTGNCTQVVHKSGRMIVSRCYNDFRMVGGNFIAGYRDTAVDLFTLTGRQLPVPGLTDVREIENVIILVRLGKNVLATPKQLAAVADGVPLPDQFVFDHVVALSKGRLLVRNGILEGTVNSNLQFTIPLDRHTLTQTPFALLETRPTGTLVHGLSDDLKGKEWHSVAYHQHWLILQANGRTQLYHVPSKKMAEVQADSVWFERQLAFVQSGEQVRVFLSATRALDLSPDSKIKFIAARDSVRYFYTEVRNKRSVFGLADGAQRFVTELELMESIGDYVVVARSNRRGLLNSMGKEVVPVEMETLVLNPAGQLSLLKAGKFGLYDFNQRKLIKPDYERNIVALHEHYLVAFRNGKYGIIGWDSKAVSPFDYDEVVLWQGDWVWVKQNRQWLLLNFKTGEVKIDKVRAFSWLRQGTDEHIVRIQRENFFGILSSTRGLVIPPTFHQITNLGTPDSPFYLTEKQVEEAGIYVIIYYNAEGKLVRRQALEEDEYEALVCGSN